MKSWISFLLPDDEYKERKVLYFIAEASAILVLALLFIFLSSKFGFIAYSQIDLEFVLFLSIALFCIYVLVRYTMAGMEYPEIATKASYKKELKKIGRGTYTFAAMFMLLYLLVTGIPSNTTDWAEITGFPLVVGVFWFLFNFISLKKSYNRNKELL